jgi:hypothetical protein
MPNGAHIFENFKRFIVKKYIKISKSQISMHPLSFGRKKDKHPLYDATKQVDA